VSILQRTIDDGILVFSVGGFEPPVFSEVQQTD